MPAQLLPGGGDASFEELPPAAGPSDILARHTAQKILRTARRAGLCSTRPPEQTAARSCCRRTVGPTQPGSQAVVLPNASYVASSPDSRHRVVHPAVRLGVHFDRSAAVCTHIIS